MVEHDLAKVGVAGSSPVFRSKGSSKKLLLFYFISVQRVANLTIIIKFANNNFYAIGILKSKEMDEKDQYYIQLYVYAGVLIAAAIYLLFKSIYETGLIQYLAKKIIGESSVEKIKQQLYINDETTIYRKKKNIYLCSAFENKRSKT